jgi:hypothetical protein
MMAFLIGLAERRGFWRILVKGSNDFRRKDFHLVGTNELD